MEDYYPEKRGGGKWWAALAIGVVAVDILADETLSNSAARLRNSENPILKGSFYAGLGYMALHLSDAIPRRYDPIDIAVGKIRDHVA